MANPDFVIVAGVSLRCLEASEEEPELVGTWDRLPGDNSAQSYQRSPKRAFALVAQFDPPGDFDTLRAAISVSGQPGVATPVTVTSPADGLTRGATLECWCWLGRAAFKTKGAGAAKTTRLTAPLTLKEA